ncbi:MAG: hypothetical protein R2795_17580 [Saprospiraceae bacterium]
MSENNKDPLFRLIKSLSSAEKRHFRLYANRTNLAGEKKFVQLFDLIDKQTNYDEDLLIKKMPGTQTKGQLFNTKRHLYGELLTSLRLIYINKQIDIEIREQIDFARILYSKGMYMEGLRILERIKGVAVEHHRTYSIWKLWSSKN